MKSLGAAILGDELYGTTASNNHKLGSSSSCNSSSSSSVSTNGGDGGIASADVGSPSWHPDRMYLHAAAIRVQLPSGAWFQALDLPSEGSLFQHTQVQKLCAQLLPPELQDDLGLWLPDLKLLASSASA